MPDPVSETIGAEVVSDFVGDIAIDSAAGGAVDAGAAGAAGAFDAAGMGTGVDAGINASDAGLSAANAANAAGASSGVEAINNAVPGSITKGLTDAEVAGSAFAPAAAGAATGATIAADGTGGGPSMLNATSPLTALDPSTAAALGIDGASSFVGDVPIDPAIEGSGPVFDGTETATGMVPGGAPGGGSMVNPDFVGDIPIDPAAGAGAGGSMLDKGSDLLKKLGLSPATAAMLGISGAQALSTPKLPEAAKSLQRGATPAAESANSVITSGGTSSPAFATQKASIDASIDQQIKEQSAAMVQQAINSGQGADSQVTLQQINKLKTDLEAKRQTLYAQAAAQNVQAAVSQLGISDQALAQVASAQFAEDNQAKSSASETAKMALMIQALSKQPA